MISAPPSQNRSINAGDLVERFRKISGQTLAKMQENQKIKKRNHPEYNRGVDIRAQYRIVRNRKLYNGLMV